MGHQIPKCIPQGLKPAIIFAGIYGTAEAVPSQSMVSAELKGEMESRNR